MPDPLQVNPAPTFHADNAGGSPLTTVGGAVAAVGQYLTLNGAVMPHDLQSWASFVFGILLAVAGAFLKQPGK